MTDQTTNLVRELSATKCQCGGFKRGGLTFCFRCFNALPPLMRKALYQRVGHGYEEAYAAALAFLRDSRRLAARA